MFLSYVAGLALHDAPRDHYTVSIFACLLFHFHPFDVCDHSLHHSPVHLSQVSLTATLGTINVAAEVDAVKIKGDGEMHMSLSSSLLPNLNRQLQFVTYTNTLFHPSTVDTGRNLNL